MKQRKIKRKLEARIRDWERVIGNKGEKEIKTQGNSTYHKPGSNKK